jgi:uncharacterized protein (TIGR03067 family)
MRRVTLITGALVLVAAVGQTARGADDGDDAKIRGAWQLVSKTKKGVETKINAKGDNASDDLPMSLTFEEQSFKVNVGSKGLLVEKTGAYSLDPTQTPKVIDFTIREGKDYVDAHAVYRVEQDRLYIRVREALGQRPPDFEIADDDAVTLVFDRVT